MTAWIAAVGVALLLVAPTLVGWLRERRADREVEASCLVSGDDFDAWVAELREVLREQGRGLK